MLVNSFCWFGPFYAKYYEKISIFTNRSKPVCNLFPSRKWRVSPPFAGPQNSFITFFRHNKIFSLKLAANQFKWISWKVKANLATYLTITLSKVFLSFLHFGIVRATTTTITKQGFLYCPIFFPSGWKKYTRKFELHQDSETKSSKHARNQFKIFNGAI